MTERATEALERLSVHALVPSKTNPRAKLDKAGLEELTESVRAHGILQAILVRRIPKESRIDGIEYEIVAGHRRWRAALAAKLTLIPAQVRELSDEQVLELQLIENLQRQDIHPLDEANGYKRLVGMGHSVEDIAARVSKSASYIYQRLKLAELIPDGQAAFRETRISAGHAVQIARLQAPDQVRVLDWCLGAGYLPHSDKARRQKARKEGEAQQTVRELAEFIEREIHLALDRAPFPVADALLVEKAGACTTCPKRTGFNKGLFPDIRDEDTCTDPACYHEKVAALVQLKVEEHQADAGPTPDLLADGYERAVIGKREAITPEHYAIVEKKSQACAFTRDAILATGPNAGKTVSACTDRKCKTHFDKDGRRRYPGDHTATPDAKKQDGNLKLARAVRGRVLVSILEAAPKKLGREELNLTALSLFEHLPGNFQEIIANAHKWPDPKTLWGCGGEPAFKRIQKLSDAWFARFVIELLAVPQSHVAPYEAERKSASKPPFILGLLAKRAKVNVAQIERQARKEKKAKKQKPVMRAKDPAPKRAKKLHASATSLKARSRAVTKAVRKAGKKEARRVHKAKSKK